MARQRGNLGGAIASSGTLLDTVQVRIETIFDGRGIAQALSGIASLKAAITGTGGVSLGDAMTAALVTPVLVATTRITSMRREMALLTSEVRAAAMLTAGGGGLATLGATAVGPWLGRGGVAGGVVGPVIDARRTPGVDGRPIMGRVNNRWAPRFDTESDDLAGAARGGGGFGPPIFMGGGGAGASGGGDDDDDDRRPRRRRNWFQRTFSTSRARRGFQTGYRGAVGEAETTLGMAAGRTGATMRGAAGTGIARALGLTALGSVFGNLISVAGALAQVLGGVLAGAFGALMTPIGLLVAGITALVALFVAANWDTFKEFAEWLGERGKVLLGEGWDDVVRGWDNVKAAFMNLWDSIKRYMRDDGDSLINILKFFGEAALRILNSVGELFGGLLTIVADVVNAIAALIRGDLTGVFEHLGDAIKHSLDTVVDVFMSWFPEIEEPWNAFWDRMQKRVEDFSTWLREHLPNFGEGRSMMSPADAARESAVTPKGFFKGGNGETSGIGGDEEVMDEETLRRLERGNQLAADFGSAITSAFAQAVTGGGSLKDILRSLVLQLVEMVFQMAVLEPMARQLSEWFSGIFKGGNGGGKDSKGGAGSNLFSSIISAVGSLFSGGFAKGGFIPPGKWGITGENGPEPIFGGRMGVTVHPNGGGGAAITYAPVYQFTGTAEEINAVKRMVANDRAQFTAKVGAVVGNMNSRGRGWTG